MEESSPMLAEPPEATEMPSGEAPPVNLAVILGIAVLAVAVVFIKKKEI